MSSCTIINKYMKLIGDTLYIGDRKIENIPIELRKVLLKKTPKITVNSVRIFIDEWKLKNGKFKKTLRGYIHKWL